MSGAGRGGMMLRRAEAVDKPERQKTSEREVAADGGTIVMRDSSGGGVV